MLDKLTQKSWEEIQSTLKHAPTSIQNNVQDILEGMWIPDLSTIEWLNRQIPYLDVKHIVNILIWWGLATITHHIATKWWWDESMYRPLFNYIDTHTPTWIESTLNALNETILFFVKWKDYWDGAVLWMISRISILVWFMKWVIPWRGDQISFKKEFKTQMDEGIEEGTFPYMWSWHTVAIWMRAPIAYAEIDNEGTSLFKAIRENKWEIVLIQSDGPVWQPTALKTQSNDKRIFANNSKLQEEGVATAENYRPAIVSWAYKANNIFINCKDIPLFWDYIVDNEWGEQPGTDLSFVRHLVRHAVELRRDTHAWWELLNVVLVMPEYTRQKAHDDWGDNLETTISNNFNKGGEDYNISYISRESTFVDMLIESIKENKLDDKMIYIDTEWSDIQWAERCKEMLIKSIWCDPEMIITDPEKLKEYNEVEKIAVLLRNSNRMIGASTRHSINNRWVTHVFYPQTSREDLVRHTNNDGEWRRIPIPYESEIGKLAFEKLS